ncbi:MAG: hypothetical protein ABN479_03340, partial [Billgrantia sp.]
RAETRLIFLLLPALMIARLWCAEAAFASFRLITISDHAPPVFLVGQGWTICRDSVSSTPWRLDQRP